MKNLFYGFAVIAGILFIISTINLAKQLSAKNLIPSISKIKGFEDTNSDNDYNNLVKKYKDKIEIANKDAIHDQNIYFWFSFLVTALTAGATLVSAIQAAKRDPSNPTRFAILLAVIAFCSTLVSFVSTHFNEKKTEAVKKVNDLNTNRSQFFVTYDKATTPETKAAIIREFNALLDN